MPEQIREVPHFDAVDLRGIGRLVVEYGETQTLTVDAAEETLDKVETFVEGTTLVIKLKVWDTIAAFKPVGNLSYRITAPTLRSVRVTGAGSASVSVAADAFEAILTGAGEYRAGIRTKKLDVSVSGAGHVVVKGEADTQKVSVSGAGDYAAPELESREASVTISGAGKARVSASEKLDVHISGAGTVEYAGDPHVTQNISGLGSVKPV